MDAIHVEDYKGYTVKIVQDNDSDNPRNWDNAGKMICWHNRYELGNEQPKNNPQEWLAYLLQSKIRFNSRIYNDILDMDTNTLLDKLAEFYIFLPLYLYDHSGITISTSHGYPFNDRWDAGQVGFIYISKQDAVKEWGKKLFTKTVETKAVGCLKSEVATYNDYLTGNVCGYQVCDEDGEVLDSCYGFYPDHDGKPDSDYAYCLQEAKSMVDWYVKQDEQKKWEDAQALDLVQSLDALC
jgi:hypothetical protein